MTDSGNLIISQKLVDNMTTLCDCSGVQILDRKEHDNTNQQFRFQSAKPSLNRLSPGARWVPVKAGNLSRQGASPGGIFFALNPSGGKQSAQGQNRYRRLATLGHARTATLTDQQEQENDRTLSGAVIRASTTLLNCLADDRHSES